VRKLASPPLLLVVALLLTACGDGAAGPASSSFRTRVPGVLTVGTELPNPPFVLGEDLDDLQGGYEVELVEEIARRLDIATVAWVNFPFNGLVAGAPCPCDFDVNGVSILPARQGLLDFSAPYFTANQGVLVRKGTRVAGVADARKLRFGVQKGSSGALYLEATLRPERNPRAYDSTTAALLALVATQVDAVISDVPIVLDGARHHRDLEVVGQFKTDERYGAVLAKGSPNTRPLSEVIDRLRAEGFLDRLHRRYFPEQVRIPTLG
jgi:polar amino acid transport system substrate-binding protein